VASARRAGAAAAVRETRRRAAWRSIFFSHLLLTRFPLSPSLAWSPFVDFDGCGRADCGAECVVGSSAGVRAIWRGEGGGDLRLRLGWGCVGLDLSEVIFGPC
jgi:hypothetical protein